MMIWESSRDLLRCTNVPEVVGTKEEILGCGIQKEQEEHTPKPRCKECGYTPIEWLRHWAKALKHTIMRAPAEEYRRECMELIRRRCA